MVREKLLGMCGAGLEKIKLVPFFKGERVNEGAPEI